MQTRHPGWVEMGPIITSNSEATGLATDLIYYLWNIEAVEFHSASTILHEVNFITIQSLRCPLQPVTNGTN